MSEQAKPAFLKSRTGYLFSGQVEIELDGALVILTTHDHGFKSAHRDYARQHFGTGRLWKMNALSWVNCDGVRVALTRWKVLEQ